MVSSNASQGASAKTIDVVAIGNALVDILVKADDSFLNNLHLNKGTMTLLDDSKAKSLFGYFSSIKQNMASIATVKEMSGGTAANAMAGVTSLGGKAAFIGKVHDDVYGKRFKEKLQERGITFTTPDNGDATETGRCLVIVTPDGARTMCTYLGASTQFGEADIDETMIAQAKVLFCTAYSLDSASSKAAILKAMTLAHKHGTKVAFSLCNESYVERFEADLNKLLEEHVDILFSNEEELQALCHTKDQAAAINEMVKRYANGSKIAALTCGKDGAVIVSKDGVLKVPTELVNNVEDTTGAGASFVSGFLYGQTHGFDLEKSGKLGNMAAGEIIKTFGARPTTKLHNLLPKLL